MITLNNSIIQQYLTDLGIPVPAGLKLIGIRGCIPVGEDSASGEISLRGDEPNIFSDTLGCFGSDFGLWIGTTLPGVVADPPNPKGLAKLCTMEDAGQSWKFVHGSHHGQYPCLIQGEPIWVRRDGGYLDKGMFAIEIHHAGVDSSDIGSYSEGCQVFKVLAQWIQFWAKVEASKQDSFEYFLIDGPAFIKWMQSKKLA